MGVETRSCNQAPLPFRLRSGAASLGKKLYVYFSFETSSLPVVVAQSEKDLQNRKTKMVVTHKCFRYKLAEKFCKKPNQISFASIDHHLKSQQKSHKNTMKTFFVLFLVFTKISAGFASNLTRNHFLAQAGTDYAARLTSLRPFLKTFGYPSVIQMQSA